MQRCFEETKWLQINLSKLFFWRRPVEVFLAKDLIVVLLF